MASNFNNKYQKYGNECKNNQNSRTKKTILAYEVPLEDPFKLQSSSRRKENPTFTDNFGYEQPNVDPFKLFGQRLDCAHIREQNVQYVYNKKAQMQRNSKEPNQQKHRSIDNASPPLLHQAPDMFPQNVNNNNYNRNLASSKYHRNRQHQYDDYLDNDAIQLLRAKSPVTKRREPLAEDHYNRYFFYEYNRQFSPPATRKKTTRKLPSLRMAANGNKTLTDDNTQLRGRDNDIVQINGRRKNRENHDYDNQNCIDIRDFKGKIINNNEVFLENEVKIMPKNLVPEQQVIKGGGDYFDSVPLNGNTIKNDKPKKKYDCTPYLPLQSRSSTYSLVCQENTPNAVEDLDKVERVAREEKRKQRQASISANTKKPKGPRVLLYNTNSPRLQGKSSSLLLNGKGMSQHRFNESKRSLAMSPVRPNRIHIKQQITPNPDPKTPAHMPFNGVVLANNFKNSKSDESDSEYDDIDDDLNGSDFIASDDSESSSDAEEGYRTHTYRLIHPSERLSSTQSYLSPQTSEDSINNPSSLLSPSLFPNVPPYLSFSSNLQKGPDVPPELHRILKWRVSNVMPKVVRCVLSNSGMRLVKKTNEWMGVWGRHMKSPCFKAIRPYQKINHLPGSFKIGRKDSCWRNLKKNMGKHSKRDFGFMPRTYIIPSDLHSLRKHWPRYAQQNVKWIIKPPASARGAGIRVINRWAQIPKRKPLIVQKYIERPLLINGSKFDLRLYVLVTSINPLRVFLYHNGLARFASVKYSDRSETLNDRCMHLTNYSINKFSSNYSKNEDVNACHGHKWTLKSLWTYLANRGVRTDQLWEAMRNLVLRTVLAGESNINNMIKYNVESKYSCYELFGFDVILDSELIPWLLEVNISPSLHSDLPLDAHVKAPLVQSVLNTALYNVPPKLTYEKQREIAEQMNYPYAGPICYDKRMYVKYLSRAEKLKHETFTRKGMEDRNEYINTILEHLTPDDVRCLIIAEDELARSGPLERIFPTNQTYRYLKYTENPRYYNRLLDAWEARYGNNRAAGIDLLRKYCEVKYHLQVPPTPAKKDSSDKQNGELANESQKTDDTTEETQS